MDLMELFFIFLGSAVVVYCGVKMLLFSRMLFPKMWFPLPKSFFTSMGEWAVVTGSSEGIGRAYALELATQGMNVVIMSRTKEKLDHVAEEIGNATGQRVKVIVVDFTEENIFSHIEEELRGLNVGVLVNNVAMLPSHIPQPFLESVEQEQIIEKQINCNVKTMMKMCKIILPRMENRGKGVIVNVSSGVAAFSCPLFTLYASTKVFVDRFSEGLHAEYKCKGIIVQAVAPFAVCTRMSFYTKSILTLSTEDFVTKSLQYLRAGDNTYGSISHIILAWFLQCIPLKILHADSIIKSTQDFVKHLRPVQEPSTST
ncbi:17-beta-hydroxysteroid dehydrogenase type 3 [Genypterus blacodes]|uniref:17-beta-hydroxysteroid dehydrogenase type 3 n=1 Tax=Genypterus blacodes TaxID=154954 RepID=UPI003F772C7D